MGEAGVVGLRCCFAAAIVLAGLNGAVAQTWPAKPIKAFIPFSAGSATNVIPRVVFEELSTKLGQPIVVENRGGAGGAIGVGAVVAAEPDGYTILANSSANTIAPWIVPNLSYNVATDLRAIIPLGKNANVLVVSPAKGWRTLQELVAGGQGETGHVQLRLRRRRDSDPYQRGAAAPRREIRSDPHPLQGRTGSARRRAGGAHRFLLLPDLDRDPAGARWTPSGAGSQHANTRRRLVGGADLARSRLPRFRLHDLVRRVRAGQNLAGDC